jgi:putative ABC transport system substrate-binding protein
MSLSDGDSQGQERLAIFRTGLEDKGWREGRNLSLDIRWAPGDPKIIDREAAALVAHSPDVIVAGGGPLIGPLKQVANSIPIVFTLAIDPVARGYVASLSRPGGNATGFLMFEYEFGVKWLELLMQIAPSSKRVAVLHDAGPIGLAQHAVIAANAPKLGVDIKSIELRSADEIGRAIELFAKEGGDGLVVTASAATTRHRDSIIGFAAKHRLPAVYPNRFHVLSGGLISYGPIWIDQYRQAADYVDRIFKGAKPADLPVQGPTRYEIVLSVATAKALGISIPPIVFARADVVLE